jgi:hypothetical protein
MFIPPLYSLLRLICNKQNRTEVIFCPWREQFIGVFSPNALRIISIADPQTAVGFGVESGKAARLRITCKCELISLMAPHQSQTIKK